MPPTRKQPTVAVTCPKCGHSQPEPPTAYSTLCKKCHEHFRVQEALHPTPTPPKPVLEQKRVCCFQCGSASEVPVAAASTMCKQCGSHVDLSDYHIAHTVSKNFRTHGRLVIEEKGYVLNADALVGGALIKGRFIGKLVTEGDSEPVPARRPASRPGARNPGNPESRAAAASGHARAEAGIASPSSTAVPL